MVVEPPPPLRRLAAKSTAMAGESLFGTTRRSSIAEGGLREKPLLVLKVGTSTLMVSDSSGQRVQLANVAQLVELIASLKMRGFQVVLVSSGAVGMGCLKLGIPKPTNLRTKQAVAAAGQSHLMRMYEDLFGTVRLQVAQLLLSQSDFTQKERWSNVKHTILECLRLGLVPIINENDSTSTDELRFGDNDNLAAVTAVQLEADGLFLFTDVDYLYTANPRSDPLARALRVVREPWALQVDTKGDGSGIGTGGMSTKIVAARMASTAGIPCGLIHGAHSSRLLSFLDFDPSAFSGRGSACAAAGEAAGGVRTGEAAVVETAEEEVDTDKLPVGTYFMGMSITQTKGDTRRWILSLPVSGELVLDDGAARAVANKKSLLPAGLLAVKGKFLRNEGVRLVHRGNDVGRGIVNFNTDELDKLRGHQSAEFEEILGYSCIAEACHRDNLVLTVAAASLKNFDVGTGPLPELAARRVLRTASGSSISESEMSRTGSTS